MCGASVPLRARVRSLLLPAAFLAAWACSHSEPFQDPDETSNGPFDPAIPIQLTYNPGLDLTPAFLPGDTIVLYSFSQSGALNPNQCIGALPVAGGTRVDESCPRSAAALDSTERYQNPVPLNDSMIVLVQSARLKGDGADAITLLGTAPWRAADQLVPRLEFPFTSPSGVFEISADFVSLTGGSSLAYLGMIDLSACPGSTPFCDQPVLIRVGREIGQLDLQSTGDPSIAPGSAWATSVATGRGAGAFLFTLPFDTRVYERQADGSTTTLFDFAPDIVRDPMVVGNQLVAIVGGTVLEFTGDVGVPLQVDGGGNIALVDLGSGSIRIVAGGEQAGYQRPVLSANGRVLVAEGPGLNLFRFDLP
jgi:hypothetical protein